MWSFLCGYTWMWCEFDGSNNGKQTEENQEMSIIDQRIWPTASEQPAKQFGFSEMTRLSPNQDHSLLPTKWFTNILWIVGETQSTIQEESSSQKPLIHVPLEGPHSSRDPSAWMICGAIKEMKSNKAAGLDDILCEQIKHLGPAVLQCLLVLFNECMSTNSIPISYGGNRDVSPYSSPVGLRTQ